MRKTKLRKRTNKTHKKRTYKRSARRVRSVKHVRRIRGGSITTPMVGSLEEKDHKGQSKIVVAGPMGVMSESDYLQMVGDIDQQGQE